LNRGDNNRTNTYEAAKMAKARALKNLWAIELGNEPDGKPVSMACKS
jgi:hypothetical protein